MTDRQQERSGNSGEAREVIAPHTVALCPIVQELTRRVK